ncbi:hypothetical protein F3087_24870 [Nocardia colli]|uniref:Uncharacterized protein n=1 Tax=Nocardia colli TaxID=2545717 RepID=A0A5N0EEM7_9NOCA|nr:hypothetical protein [Nocardia colli]KAA8885871.1 hypothetical protein F3087_24870 [Nocardia colli]
MFTHDSAVADNTSSHDTATVQDFIRRYDDTISAADFDTLPSFFDEQVLVITPTSSRCVTRAEFVAAAKARAHEMDSSFRIESTEQANAEPLARESYSSLRTDLVEQVDLEPPAHRVDSLSHAESIERVGIESSSGSGDSTPSAGLVEQVEFGPAAHGADSLSCAESIERVGIESPAGRGDSAPRTALVEQATVPLGGHCWLTSAHWRLRLGDRTLDLYSDFVVRRTDNDLRIAAYLPRQDLPQLLREAAGQV